MIPSPNPSEHEIKKLEPKGTTDNPIAYPTVDIVSALNTLIDRVNELEARYEGHRHNLLSWNGDLQVWYDRSPATTTPPTKGNQ